MNAYLSIGSNMGDRSYYLNRALALLQTVDVTVQRVSSVYVTEPWGGVEQENFWNIAVRVETVLMPLELLHLCQQIEQELGRKRLLHWGPRTIDIDILLCDNVTIQTAELTLPHPHLEERAFVLTPLREIEPSLILPSGRSIREVAGEGKVWPLSANQKA